MADSRGAVIGGHLCTGSLVRTTAELVVCLLPEWHFWRELDPATGYHELRISPLAPPVKSLSSSSTIDTVLAPLNAPDFASFFSTGHAGYTNYSTLELEP